jgi:hypothetical protein
MTDLLTVAATAVELAALGVAIVGFAYHAWSRVTETPARPAAVEPTAPMNQPVVEAETELLPDPWDLPVAEPTAAPTPLIPPAQMPVAPQPALPTTVRALRKLALERGHKGAGRWSKEKCLAALNRGAA